MNNWIFIKLLIFTIFVFIQSSIYSQITIHGKVTDPYSKPIENVLVFDTISYNSTVTDSLGNFKILIKKDVSVLSFSHVSYLPQYSNVKTNQSMKIVLEPHQMDLVVVSALSNFQNKRSGQITINKTVVKVLPSIGAEVDYIKSLVLFPGVSSGEEISKGMTVRGGNLDQNLSHINGVQTSNTGHLFNIFSAVPSIAIKDISFYKGGIPANFGNALGSSMEISLRAPMKESLQMEIGVTNSKISYENVFGKNKTSSFIISGRSSYIDFFRQKAKRNTLNNYDPWGFNSNGPTLYFGYSFYDLLANLNIDLGKKFLFNAFGLYSYDINNYIHNNRYITNLEHDLVNATYGFSVSKKWTNHQLKLIGGVNKNEVNRNERTLDFDIQKTVVKDKSLEYAYSVKNWTSRFDYNYTYGKHDFQAGIFSYYKNYHPSNGYLSTYSYNPLLHEGNVEIEQNKTEVFNFWLLGGYLQSDIQYSPKLAIHSGLRWSRFITSPAPIDAFEPRLSLNYSLSDKTSFKCSFDYLTQFDHGLLFSEAGLDNVIFIPSFDEIKPAKNITYTIGGTHKFLNKSLFFTGALFYRKLWNLQKLALDSKDNIIGDSFSELIVGKGKGTAYGVEIQSTYQKKEYLFNLSYTYSRSTRQFDDFNNDATFYFDYDKPHELTLSGAYGLGKKSSFSFNFILRNGVRYTLPSGIVNSQFGSKPILLYDGYHNEAQLPLYHRLDVGYDYAFELPGKWKGKIKLNIVNVLNTRNINFIEIKETGFSNYNVEGISYFPILPSININISYE